MNHVLRHPVRTTLASLGGLSLLWLSSTVQAQAVTPPATQSSPTVHEEVRQVEMETSGDRLAEEAFKVNDADPESSVPSMEQAMRSPLKMGYFVMLLIERGKAALENKNYPSAIKYHRALIKATPERSTGYALLCQSYEGADDWAAAIKECRTVLGKAGVTVDDNLRFVNLMLKKQSDLTPSEIEDTEAVIAHLDKELTSDDKPMVIERMRCDLATRLVDDKRLAACSGKLRELAPNDARTFAYSWALALRQHDYKQASTLIAEAKAVGLPPAAIAKMEEGLQAARMSESPWRRWLDQWGLLLGLTLVLLSVTIMLTQRRRPALTNQASPS